MRRATLLVLSLVIPACTTGDDEIEPPAPFGERLVTPVYSIVVYAGGSNLGVTGWVDDIATAWINWRVSLGETQESALEVVKKCTIQTYDSKVPGDGAREYFEYWWPNNLIETTTKFGAEDPHTGMNLYGIDWLKHGWTHALTQRGDHVGFPNP